MATDQQRIFLGDVGSKVNECWTSDRVAGEHEDLVADLFICYIKKNLFHKTFRKKNVKNYLKSLYSFYLGSEVLDMLFGVVKLVHRVQRVLVGVCLCTAAPVHI